MGNEQRGWDDSLISLGLGALVVVVSGILLYNFFSTTSKDLLTDLSNSMSQQTSSTQVEETPVASVEPTPSEQLAGIVTPLPEQTVAPASAKPSPTSAIVQATPTARPVAVATTAPAPTQLAQATIAPSVAPTTAPVAQNNGSTTTEGTIRDTHTVAGGESLWKLAERYYGDGFQWKSIAQANNINGTTLEVGTSLSIPRQGMTSSTSTVANAGDNTSDTATNPVQQGIGGSGQVASAGSVSHTVARGEVLSAIVSNVCGPNTSWLQVAKENNLVNPRVIHTGNVLQINCK